MIFQFCVYSVGKRKRTQAKNTTKKTRLFVFLIPSDCDMKNCVENASIDFLTSFPTSFHSISFVFCNGSRTWFGAKNPVPRVLTCILKSVSFDKHRQSLPSEARTRQDPSFVDKHHILSVNRHQPFIAKRLFPCLFTSHSVIKNKARFGLKFLFSACLFTKLLQCQQHRCQALQWILHKFFLDGNVKTRSQWRPRFEADNRIGDAPSHAM